MPVVPTTNGTLLALQEVTVTPQGAMCTNPGVIGGAEVPQSPVVYDTLGANLRDVLADTPGAARVEWWRSIESADPVAPGDFSNIRWLFIGFQEIREPGVHPPPRGFLDMAAASRYLKLDPTAGVVSSFFAYGS